MKNLPMQLPGGQIDIVNDFTYMGSTITRDCKVKEDVKLRFWLPTESGVSEQATPSADEETSIQGCCHVGANVWV